MPHIGFRFAPCTDPSLEIFPGLQIVYYGKTAEGVDVEGPGSNGWITVSTAILNAEAAVSYEAVFSGMVKTIAKARLNAFQPSNMKAWIDDTTTPNINTLGLVSEIIQTFESLAAFDQFMGETWGVQASQPDDQVDVQDPSYKAPFSL